MLNPTKINNSHTENDSLDVKLHIS